MTRAGRALAAAAVVALAACPPARPAPAEPPPAPVVDRADTPAPPGATFDGTVSVYASYNGNTLCDLDATLTGVPSGYAGACEGCAFAFDVDSTVTRDDGNAWCDPMSPISFVSDGTWTDLVLGWAPAFVNYVDGYGAYAVRNALVTGYGFYYYAYPVATGYTFPGPYFYAFLHDDQPYTQVSLDGDALSWRYEVSRTYDYWRWSYLDFCYSDVVARWGEGPLALPDATGTSTVDCAGETIDRWTFTAIAPTVRIAVDTVAPDSAFDGQIVVMDGDACLVGDADDTFECTFAPTSYACPAARLDDASGEYAVLVHAFGSCTGDVGAYAISVEGGTDLVLAADDAPATTIATYTREVRVEGRGTITPAR